MKRRIAIVGHVGNGGISSAIAARIQAEHTDVEIEFISPETATERGINFIRREEPPLFIDPAPLLKYNYQAPPESSLYGNKRKGSGGKKNKRNHKY